jgi:hypothetical protein
MERDRAQTANHGLFQLVTEAYGHTDQEFTCNVSREPDGVCILTLQKPRSITDKKAKGSWGIFFFRRVTLYDGLQTKTNLLVFGSLKQTATTPLLICTPIGMEELEQFSLQSVNGVDRTLVKNKAEINKNAQEINAEGRKTLKIRFTKVSAAEAPARTTYISSGDKRNTGRY